MVGRSNCFQSRIQIFPRISAAAYHIGRLPGHNNHFHDSDRPVTVALSSTRVRFSFHVLSSIRVEATLRLVFGNRMDGTIPGPAVPSQLSDWIFLSSSVGLCFTSSNRGMGCLHSRDVPTACRDLNWNMMGLKEEGGAGFAISFQHPSSYLCFTPGNGRREPVLHPEDAGPSVD